MLTAVAGWMWSCYSHDRLHVGVALAMVGNAAAPNVGQNCGLQWDKWAKKIMLFEFICYLVRVRPRDPTWQTHPDISPCQALLSIYTAASLGARVASSSGT